MANYYGLLSFLLYHLFKVREKNEKIILNKSYKKLFKNNEFLKLYAIKIIKKSTQMKNIAKSIKSLKEKVLNLLEELAKPQENLQLQPIRIKNK